MEVDLYTHPGGQVTLVPPPPGFTSDFDHPQRHYVLAIYRAAAVCNVVALVFMGIRCYTNFRIQKRFALEDGLLITAYALVITHTALTVRLVAEGTMGTHAYELELDRILDYSRDFYPMPIIYPLCCMFAKLSLVVFYGRLSNALAYRLATWAGAFFIFASMVGLAIATAAPCQPLERAWNPLVEGSCISRPAAYESTAIMGLLSDIYLIVLPVPIVVRLQIPWQQKIGLLLIFGIGVLTIFTSAMRLYVIVAQFSSIDVTWGASLPAFWFIIEGYLMVVCATLPSIRKFLRHVAPKVLGEFSRSGNTPPLRGSNKVVTIGSARTRGQMYDRFDENSYGLGLHDVDVPPVPQGPFIGEKDTFPTIPRNPCVGDEDNDSIMDEGSQDGILQTRTVSVLIE